MKFESRLFDKTHSAVNRAEPVCQDAYSPESPVDSTTEFLGKKFMSAGHRYSVVAYDSETETYICRRPDTVDSVFEGFGKDCLRKLLSRTKLFGGLFYQVETNSYSIPDRLFFEKYEARKYAHENNLKFLKLVPTSVEL